MQSIFLKAKLHQARVTHAELEYDGSCAIDEDLLKLTGLREFEQIQVYNITNGERLTTYIIRGEAGSGIISMNGAAAHKASPGDRVIICAYANYTEQELTSHEPALVYLGENNQVVKSANTIAVQAA